jgi:hypothetical protein
MNEPIAGLAYRGCRIEMTTIANGVGGCIDPVRCIRTHVAGKVGKNIRLSWETLGLQLHPRCEHNGLDIPSVNIGFLRVPIAINISYSTKGIAPHRYKPYFQTFLVLDLHHRGQTFCVHMPCAVGSTCRNQSPSHRRCRKAISNFAEPLPNGMLPCPLVAAERFRKRDAMFHRKV